MASASQVFQRVSATFPQIGKREFAFKRLTSTGAGIPVSCLTDLRFSEKVEIKLGDFIYSGVKPDLARAVFALEDMLEIDPAVVAGKLAVEKETGYDTSPGIDGSYTLPKFRLNLGDLSGEIDLSAIFDDGIKEQVFETLSSIAIDLEGKKIQHVLPAYLMQVAELNVQETLQALVTANIDLQKAELCANLASLFSGKKDYILLAQEQLLSSGGFSKIKIPAGISWLVKR